MRLSSLPYIVKKLVLDHLSINHIFFLTLCSKNLKNFIVQTQRYQLDKKIDCISYCIRSKRTIDIVSLAFRECNDSVMHLIPADSSEAVNLEEVRVNVLGISIEFCRSPINQTDLRAKYTPENFESIIETIHNHLYELFGHRTDFELLCLPGPETRRFLPVLRNIQELKIYRAVFATARIEKLLSSSNCLEYFQYDVPRGRTVEFEATSRIYELDTLDVVGGRRLPTDVMKYFKGRHAFLDCNSIKTRNVIRFLNQWRSEEKFRNLEVITMSNGFDTRQIRRSVRFKTLGKKVKYSFTSKFQEPNRLYPSEFESRLYLVRESDGHVASVLLGLFQIFMGVWNMTEAEFLEKFQRDREVPPPPDSDPI